MAPQETANTKLSIDTRLLSNFIIELNIARRHFIAYPPGHPLIGTALDKVMRVFEQLLEFSNQITLAVARDALMVGYALLDRKNPVYRDFANTLFNHDIGTITFRKDLQRDELYLFNEILTFSREEVRQRGGIEQIFSDTGFQNLSVKGIRYDYFRTIEEPVVSVGTKEDKSKGTPLLWENFAHGLLDGTLNPHGDSTTFVEGLEPELLAELMNELEDSGERPTDNYAEVIASFVGNLEQSESDVARRREPIAKLSAFVERLNPRLRRQFLDGAFASFAQQPQLSEEILAGLPEEIIVEALEDINDRSTYVPPMIVTILQKLSKNASPGRMTSVLPLACQGFSDSAGDQLRVLFQEDDLDTYVPDAYQETLRTITRRDKLVVPELEEVSALLQTLEEHNIECQISLMLQDIIASPPEGQLSESVEQKLVELAWYFLEVGDFSSLSELYLRLTADHAVMDGAFGELHGVFTGEDFVLSVLDGFSQWEKDKFDEIQRLISHVGRPFVEPLLERLAVEQTLSHRRAYLNSLLALGEAAREGALSRLGDNRWYLVRNMIVLLRNLNDRDLMVHFRRLKNHSHPRVRYEILRTLQHFRDPEADRLLLQYMDGSERDLRLNAIVAAEYSSCPVVFQKLLDLVGKGGFTGFDFDARVAALRSLANKGNCTAVPHIWMLLESKSRWRPALLNRLKAEAIRTLVKYPAAVVAPVLNMVLNSEQPELAPVARDVLNTLQEQSA